MRNHYKRLSYQGLSEQLKDELISYPEPSDLDNLVTLAIRVDNRVRERRREKQWGPSNQSETRLPFGSGSGPERVDNFPSHGISGGVLPPDPEPMQVGAARVN